jgi:hypothetical protein
MMVNLSEPFFQSALTITFDSDNVVRFGYFSISFSIRETGGE